MRKNNRVNQLPVRCKKKMIVVPSGLTEEGDLNSWEKTTLMEIYTELSSGKIYVALYRDVETAEYLQLPDHNTS